MLLPAALGVVACDANAPGSSTEPAPVEPPTQPREPVPAIAIGDAVPTLWVRADSGEALELDLSEPHAATVIWFSSCTCKCVSECEERIHALLDRYDGKRVRFLSINSNPHDTRGDIAALRERLESPYAIERDVDGRSMQHLGIRASASVAVLDGAGRLRYRGAIDDDRYAPQVSYVHEAVDAILGGEALARTEETSYGCLYPLAGF